VRVCLLCLRALSALNVVPWVLMFCPFPDLRYILRNGRRCPCFVVAVYSIDALFALYRTTEFAVYAAVIAGTIVVSLFVIHWMERRLRIFGEHHAK